MILDRNGLTNVRVEPVAGQLTDHYDPRSKVIRLSEDNFRGNSIAGVSVAAHEVGHAIQDASGYVPMRLRAGIFPIVNFSSQIWPWLSSWPSLSGRGESVRVAPDQRRHRVVPRGPSVPHCDAAGRDQRLHPRLVSRRATGYFLARRPEGPGGY